MLSRVWSRHHRLALAVYFTAWTVPVLILYVLTVAGGLANDGLDWIIERRPE